MQILESFNEGLFEVYLGVTTQFSWTKYLIVKSGDNCWTYFLTDGFDCYEMIGKFLSDLSDQIKYMDLADGIEGVYDFLNDLRPDEENGCKFINAYS